MMTYPRSPKVLLGGIAHLGRFIDKIKLRREGKIQDYNYITVGFDKYLIDFLQIDPKAFEPQVLAGKSDEQLLAWVTANGCKAFRRRNCAMVAGHSDEPPEGRHDPAALSGRLQEIATKRGVPVASLPPASTWVDAIELDEGRM